MRRLASIAAIVLAALLLPAIASAESGPMASAPLPPPLPPMTPQDKPVVPVVHHVAPRKKTQPAHELATVPRPQEKPRPPAYAVSPKKALPGSRAPTAVWEAEHRAPPWAAPEMPGDRRFAGTLPAYGYPKPWRYYPRYQYYSGGPYAYGPPYPPPYGPGYWR